MFASAIPFLSKGGMQDMVWMLATGLAERGHLVVIFVPPAPDGIGDRWLDGVHVIHSRLPMRWIFRTVRKDANRLFTQLDEQQGRFDLVHTHSAGGYLFQRYNAGRGRERTPLAMSLYGTAIDEIVTLARLLSDAHAQHGLRLDTKRVLGIAYFYLGLLMTRRTFAEGSDALFVTSQQQKGIAVRHYRFRPEKVHVLPNAVRTDQFTPPPDDCPISGRLLAVARLLEQKGVQVVIRALPRIRAAIPTATLDIVGDGEYRRRLVELVADLGLGSCVTFHGSVDYAALPQFYRSCDLFVNPTLRANGYDLTVLQAMACGRPVVASDVGSLPELVTGATGILTPPGDEGAFAGAVIALLQDETHARQMGRAARSRVEAEFSLDALLDGTLEIYGQMLALPPRKA